MNCWVRTTDQTVIKMSDKELSHQDSALLFINSLQNELAKTKAAAQSQRNQADPLKMPLPSQQIRRLQNPRGESQSEHSLQPQGTILTVDQARRKPKDDDPDLFTLVGDEVCRRPLFFGDADFLLFQCRILLSASRHRLEAWGGNQPRPECLVPRCVSSNVVRIRVKGKRNPSGCAQSPGDGRCRGMRDILLTSDFSSRPVRDEERKPFIDESVRNQEAQSETMDDNRVNGSSITEYNKL